MYISDYRRKAREMLAGRWGLAILVTLVASIFGAAKVSGSLNIEIKTENLRMLPEHIRVAITMIGLALAGLSGILATVQFVFGGVVRLGFCRFWLKAQDGEEPAFKDLFSRFNRFGDGFLLNLLMGLYIVLWMLLFIIPGIIASYSYSMAHYIMEENPEMKASEAIRASKELMRGHKAELFVLNLSFIGWMLLSILTFGIGFLWLNPYMEAAHAAFYRSLQPRDSYQTEQPENWDCNGTLAP